MQDKIIQRIEVPRGTCKKLCNMFGCASFTVRAALRFASSSDLSQKIQQSALEDFGGRIVYITEPHAQNL